MATARTSSSSPHGRLDFETETFIVQPAQTVALRGRDGGATAELGGEQANALRASGGGGSDPYVLAPITFQTHGSNLEVGSNVSGTLGTKCGQASGTAPCVAHAFDARQQDVIQYRMAVRRLMPVECERLQGFPDGFTDIPTYKRRRTGPRGGNYGAADGLRYKSLGNSMATKVMSFIGRRIEWNLAVQPDLDELVG